MSKESNSNAVDLFCRISSHLSTIATNLRTNHLNRAAIQTLLLEYAARAESDVRLVNASRQDDRCVEHGVFLSYTHVELLTWLTNHNYTVPATATKWYSWRRLLSSKYRLPSVLSSRAQAANLRDLLRNVVVKAELLNADLRANGVEVPEVAIDYREVVPRASQGTRPEALEELLRRAAVAEVHLGQGES
ncbi:glyoxalase family protein [Aspergillus cavernicola]|uniref:Glyoxalase family protein n=1 Tax=Aspergillus cavernicola TaxID=176166 RepID=A0ABR4HNI9_9EURO